MNKALGWIYEWEERPSSRIRRGMGNFIACVVDGMPLRSYYTQTQSSA